MKTNSKFKNESSWQAIYQSVMASSKYKTKNFKLPQFVIKSSIVGFKEFYSIWQCLPNYVQIRQP